MEGQGVAASSASAVGRQGQYGPAETHVTSDIRRGGEGRGRNGDDSHVMMEPGHLATSFQDDGMSPTPDSSQPPRLPTGGQARPSAAQASREPEGQSAQAPGKQSGQEAEGQSAQEPGGQSGQEAEGQSPQGAQTEFSSQQIKSDKADNIGDPDRNNSVVARDENTGHNKTAAGLASSAVDAPAVNSSAAEDSGEPETVQFAAVPPEDPESGPAEPATSPDIMPPAMTGEPETVQFAAIPPEPSQAVPEPPQTVVVPEPPQTVIVPEFPQTVIVPEPVARPAAPEPPADSEPAGNSEPAADSEAATDSGSADAEPEPQPAPAAPATVAASARNPEAQAPQAAPPGHTRVDARLLEAALLNLRKRIAAIPLVFQISGSAEAKIERGKLLSQIDDYLLPRVRRSAAPILVALVGSTGAGKSTLVNSIVGAQVSATGVRRPTTNSPVLACHPDEIDWFAENNFLPTLPRVRQEGLARPGRDGLLVLAASEGMPRGIALLDTPDIDSVVQAHHEFALQFLDASDLWLFMTSASRYADGPVWEILQHARDRKASLGVVLSRIPQAYRTELVDHFNAMLDANGIAAADRFVIQETPLINGMLPADAYQPVRDWLADTAARSDRRVAVLSRTMSGVLDTFKSRVPAIAAHVEPQVVLRG